MFDQDPATTIFDEILVEYLGIIKGSYSKTINNVLKQYGGISQVTGKPNFALGVHFNRSDGDVWTIRTQPGAKSDFVITLADEVEEALSRLNCFRHVAIQSKPLRLVLYHKKPRPVLLRDWLQEIDSLEKNKYLMAPTIHWLGRKESLAVFDLTQEKFCHMLVAGITGSGKSQLLLSMILSLAINTDPLHCSMLILDPKGIDFARGDIAKLPHLMTKPIVDIDEAAKVIHAIRLELDRRMAKGDFAEAKKAIFIFADEMASITEASDEAIKDLTAIARLGRAWGIHIIAATQRPTSKSIDTTLRSQLVCNITGSVTSPEEAKYATGYAESGADRLPGHGTFILNTQQYKHHRLQGLLAADYGFIVDAIINEYNGQKSHFSYGVVQNDLEARKSDSSPQNDVIYDETDGKSDQLKILSGDENSVILAPKFITSRQAFVDQLLELKRNGSDLNQSQVRKLHKETQGTELNADTANKVLEYVQNSV